MRFIGDVHGHIDKYLELIEDAEASIQVGDMGIGFADVELPKMDSLHRFINGNHDNPELCKKHPNFLPSGTFSIPGSIFNVNGAWSIDWEWRQAYERQTGTKVWWENEESSVKELQEIIDIYSEIRPLIVVSHDCPSIMALELLSHHSLDKSRTRLALDAMFEYNKPEYWIFGHHHRNMVKDIQGTRFVCLDELVTFDLEV